MKNQDLQVLLKTEERDALDLSQCCCLFSMADLFANNPMARFSMDLDTVQRVCNSFLIFVQTTRLYFGDFFDKSIAPDIDEDARGALDRIVGLSEKGVKEVSAYHGDTMTLIVLTALIMRKVKQKIEGGA